MFTKWGNKGCCMPKNNQNIKLRCNSDQTDNFWNFVNFTSAYIFIIIWDNLQPFPWNMFHVRRQCCMSNDLLSISSSKRCLRHMYSLFSVCAFYSVNAICQVKTRKKWGQHMAPWVCVCVCLYACVRDWENFSSLYFGELERCLSALLFPTNQVLPTCQPRRDARPFKTLC